MFLSIHRQISVIIFGLFFCAICANAQTLGQVAEKERVRRSSLGQNHASELITEAQLGSSEDDEDEVEASTEVAVSEDEIPVAETSALSLALGDPAERAASDPWPDLYEGYRTAYRDAKAELSHAEAYEHYCDGGTAPPERPDTLGWYWTVDCASMPERVAQAEQSMQDVETACHDHARRLRIAPGRARLE